MVSDFMGFGLSGQIDYARGDYKFGFMMHVVPQPEGGAGGPPAPARPSRARVPVAAVRAATAPHRPRRKAKRAAKPRARGGSASATSCSPRKR